jgi:phosphoglycerate dehydrogenase-like enzyme
MKYKVLITAPYMAREKRKILKMLKEHWFKAEWVHVDERLEEADLLPIIGKYDGILCGDDRITKRVIDAAVNLKVIVKWGTGIDSIQKEYAESKGIQVLRTPNAFTEPVSDTALAMMLCEARGLIKNDRVVKSGRWDKPQGYMMQEKTVGIIGFGNIGQAVAKRLIPFGPKVLVNDIKPISKKTLASLKAEHVSKDTLFAKCDIITLHTDLNPASEHMLDKKAFAKMKKKPFIINTARGPLIKEEDLISALRKGQIAGIGIDVFEHEPLAKNNPLRSMDTVIASCHNSNSSPTCWDKVHEGSLEMMEEGLKR